MDLPRFDGHSETREYARWESEMEKGQRRKRREVFGGVQGRDGAADSNQRQKQRGDGDRETPLRRWVAQAEVEAGRGPAGALKQSEREELRELRRENQRLRMEREILKSDGLCAKESE